MLSTNKILQKVITCVLVTMLAASTVNAQTTSPTWWFGASGAANFNFYDGTTQRLNNSLIAPTAFHKGRSVRPYASILAEYRPAGIWGGMLNVAYDGRGGKFNDVVAPCDCPATLKTSTSYITVEPSLRLSVPASGLYFFAGPRVSFNINKDFAYTQLRQPNTDGELSAMHKTIFSGQVGAGYDIMMSSANSTTKVSLSPFVAFIPYFGQEPRTIESWSVTTVRAGIALKFGKAKKMIVKETVATPVPLPMHDFTFNVRAPKAVSLKRQVSETLPLRNSVFFDEGSTQVPARYVLLSKEQAGLFREEQLQADQPDDMTGRSARQLTVYHNILNITGDRLRSNPGAVISLSGASAKGPEDGIKLAESVKLYLVDVFGIDGSRITVKGRNKPVIPSEQPGGTKELVLLRAGDRRVDITSASPELLEEVGGDMLKPVQINATQADPLDSQIVLNIDSAAQLLKSWSVDITDDKGIAQHYGPYTRDQESIPGAAILGNNPEGDYKLAMTGETKAGMAVRKEGTVHLVRQDEATAKGLRYSILYEFDKGTSIARYDKFLTEVVAPSIADGSTVIIHGHTDIIGEEDHNMKLSRERAHDVQNILERALAKAGKNNVKFETLGFGEDISKAPFENTAPEERFYNRTVIIDIVPVK
ncbi:OmpA family protein [Mucilaginibacter xinganensis]|uniref:Outer membrane protein OmpA n=1 Tax=Mucilaginibacter xinganensis TaxID=1234841 RepID=A0A223P2C6_9SPHI|nr:OmpA family protein [Mucilaginibacter xinganensis]ASU36283.1 Outer membrane protein OmpA [Mucilaginibacter xinganensis]